MNIDKEQPIETVEETVESAAEDTSVETTDESDASAEKETESPEEQDKKPSKPKKSGVEKRIDKLVKQRAQAQNESAQLRARLEALERGSQPKSDLEKQSGKPKADDFKTHEEYVEALTDYKIEQREAKRREDAVKEQESKKLSTHQERLKAFVKSHDDFDDVVAEVDDVPISLTVREAILNSDNGPELMYTLAQHPEEYQRICQLSHDAANRALGKFEAKFLSKETSEQKPEPKKVSRAPKPGTPVGTRSTHATSIYDPNVSFKEFERLENERLKQKRMRG